MSECATPNGGCGDRSCEIMGHCVVGGHGLELARLRNYAELFEVALTPRRWTREMNEAWHRAIPDVETAFAKLRELAKNLAAAGGSTASRSSGAEESVVAGPGCVDEIDQELPYAEQRYRDGLDEALGEALGYMTDGPVIDAIRGLMKEHGEKWPRGSRHPIDSSSPVGDFRAGFKEAADYDAQTDCYIITGRRFAGLALALERAIETPRLSNQPGWEPMTDPHGYIDRYSMWNPGEFVYSLKGDRWYRFQLPPFELSHAGDQS